MKKILFDATQPHRLPPNVTLAQIRKAINEHITDLKKKPRALYGESRQNLLNDLERLRNPADVMARYLRVEITQPIGLFSISNVEMILDGESEITQVIADVVRISGVNVPMEGYDFGVRAIQDTAGNVTIITWDLIDHET